jgi:hypothetical protein
MFQFHFDHFVVDPSNRSTHQAVARLADALEAVGFHGHPIGKLAC